ncbi:MAG: methyltransferase domain-containing protein [Rudaea sp.]|nr:methyltransferase domain-containing protein [Rudaea sp.]
MTGSRQEPASDRFFPAHNPRALEYPWLAENVPADLRGLRLLDVGAGVNPLPFVFADRGAVVVTLDNHPATRDPDHREHWNEWGSLDYSRLDPRISSLRVAYEQSVIAQPFDCIYSVSVIEHLPWRIRRQWLGKFAQQLKSRGVLLLTVDLVPDTDLLWNMSEGNVVEDAAVHGEFSTLIDELGQTGFAVADTRVERRIPATRVDVGFIKAMRR